MPDICTCAKSLDTEPPRPGGDAQCPTCGHMLVTTDATTAIQVESPSPPTRIDSDPAFDAVVRSVRMKSKAARGVKGCISIVVAIAILAVLVSLPLSWLLLTPFKDDGRDTARIQIKGPLSTAVQAYFLKHNGEFPPTLDKLLERDQVGGPYVEHADAFKDPWGNRYQYDIKGPHNNGARPDIWTIAPDDTIIGNWQKIR